MTSVNQYLEANRERFLEKLFELLRIPSISADSTHRPDMDRCAELLHKTLLESGADRAEIFPTAGPSIVYAEKIVDPSAPTVLIYGHYDVMPVDPIELWHTDPFEPVVRDGKIWGRGADDDKGQSFMHIAAFEAMVATGALRCNVKFMFEGEEEIGSKQITLWCQEHKELLSADIILVSDTSLLGMETPSITCGLRGLAFVEAEVTGPNRDLHSGLYGGAVPNPINILSKMIGSLVDDNGRITIPGFYDGVFDHSFAARDKINSAPFDEAKFAQSIGCRSLTGELGYSSMERKGTRPTMDVCGIWGGYTGEGAKTVIPSKATAKISMRLVAGQDFNDITEKFTRHFKAIAPPSVTVKITPSHGGYPYIAPTDTPAYRAASGAMSEAFGREPLPFYSGGSIPIISTFERLLNVKTILMGFGLDTDAIHSPNENYPLENFYKGMSTIPLFFDKFADEMIK